MLLLPLLAGGAPPSVGAVPLWLFQGGLILVVILVSLRWVVPALLYRAARVRSSEVFLITVVGICVLTVYVSGLLGLSFASVGRSRRPADRPTPSSATRP